MKPSALPLIGRVLIALIFAYFGYMKAMNFGGTIGYFTKWGFPLPQVAAALAVIFELGGGILLIIGWKTRWVAWALALYTVVATAVAHRYWTYPPEQAFNQMSHFFKNVSLIGGLLYVAAFGPGAMSVDKR
ncbi:MAG TPA: DoxX family protein [Burkholderiales bacterium]|jgi:putative oxidoreductase|nr:DoxX family protein [Burkholderiales bacterium]